MTSTRDLAEAMYIQGKFNEVAQTVYIAILELEPGW